MGSDKGQEEEEAVINKSLFKIDGLGFNSISKNTANKNLV